MSKDKFKFIATIFVLTIVVFSININLSPDYYLYRSNWNNLDSIDYSEFSWSILNLFSKNIFSDYNGFLFCISFITIYFKFKYLKDLVQSNVILIFYASSFLILHESIQIRLAFGLIFVLKSIKDSIDGKNYKSWLFLILASSIHLSLLFFIIVKLLLIIIKNKTVLIITVLSVIYFIDFILQQNNIELMIKFFSEIGEKWSEKLSKYLYEFLELGIVKTPPLQIYYVGLIYLLNSILNFKKKINKLNELTLVSFILIIPILMIPNDTITSRFIELCFYFLPFIQFKIFKEIYDQKLTPISLALLFLFFTLNFKIFTNQLI